MQSEIDSLINKQGRNDALGNIIYNLMTHCYQPYSEIMKMPLPMVFELLKIIKRENKRQEQEMKRKKHGN